MSQSYDTLLFLAREGASAVSGGYCTLSGGDAAGTDR